MINWLVNPLGPVVARDGRPFGADSGNRMRLTPWLYPSMTAGSYRTMVGKSEEEGFTPDAVIRLKEIEVAGPFPCQNGSLYFPAPKDIVLKEGGEWLRIRPAKYGDHEGTDLPQGLRPAIISADELFKPLPTRPWWRVEQMTQWLLDRFPGDAAGDGFMPVPKIDQRTHVAIEDSLGAAEDGLLFQTSGYVFDENTRLAVRVSDGDVEPGIHPFGGERRLAEWERIANDMAWECPAEIAHALTAAKQIRMVLATPAIFSDGWKPGWLDHEMRGTIPGTDTVVKLVAACVERWKPISGFSLDASAWGEKPVRRMAPAGSVYFFEIVGGGKFPVQSAWLRSVCDGDQDRLDGFGLALWGRWTEEGAKS